MTFLTPWMLIGALAAGIPVAIHLFFRSRYRTVPWAAMKFLLTSVEQTSRRLKFQEMLLLLVRMLVLVMLALAFMRPISSIVRGAGRGDAVDAVFVFDLSYSMAAQDGDGKTRLMRAQEEAAKIVDELPPHSTLQIVTCAGRDRALLGPHSPANLDQAKSLIQDLAITHLATDLQQGVAKAQEVFKGGQASNKELYVFSDMQKLGFDAQSGALKSSLQEVKEKAIVHMVRCGTNTIKNVAVVDIKPQSGVPRPGERVGFAVLVRNGGVDPLSKLTVSLAADGDKNPESTEIPRVNPNETYAVTLTAKLAKPGLHVLTAKISSDELDADNQLDQVILVRDQVNILVVDGNYDERDPEKSSSFFLMHSLLPVKETERATYKYNPRVIPARLASAAVLKNQDVCILVNCSVQAKAGLRADTLPGDFLEAFDAFVRTGHGAVIFSGDNVQPEAYNRILGQKYGLLPMMLKPAIRTPGPVPFFINRDSFSDGPSSYWKFKDDKLYEIFDAVPVWQHLDLDAMPPSKKTPKAEEEQPEPQKKDEPAKDDNPVQTIVKLNTGKPLAVSRRVDAGEVIFITTAAQEDGRDPETRVPKWTAFHRLPPYVFFLDTTLAYLMHKKTQTYNLVAGEVLHWQPTDKVDHAYSLIGPNGKVERLGQPEKENKRYVVKASNLQKAGIYRMISQPKALDGIDTIDIGNAIKVGTPIAVAPDLNESADLTTLTNAQIDQELGFQPIHITAGAAAGSTGADRLNREWTVWVLLAVLILVLFEVALAWWCGRAW